MKCRNDGAPATWMRPDPLHPSRFEGLCDPCEKRYTARLDRQQAELDRRRPRRIPTDPTLFGDPSC